MKPHVLIISLFCLIFSGCLVPSLHPFYTDETLVVEPNLVGAWAVEDMNWTFSADNEKTYKLTVVQGGAAGQFQVHLFQLEDDLFMDLYPEELPKEVPLPDFYKFHLLPVHHVMKMTVDKQRIEMHFLDLDNTKGLLKLYPQLLKHELLDDVVVLLDTPEALQTFLKVFKDHPALWHEDPIELTPVPTVDPNQND